MHSWGDNWPYWNDLYEAESFIFDYVKKHSWCFLSIKEKWGSLRYSFIFPPSPKWLSKIVIRHPWKKITIQNKIIGKRILWTWTNSWLYYKWISYGNKKLLEAVRLACKQWPHITKEITSDLHFF